MTQIVLTIISALPQNRWEVIFHTHKILYSDDNPSANPANKIAQMKVGANRYYDQLISIILPFGHCSAFTLTFTPFLFFCPLM